MLSGACNFVSKLSQRTQVFSCRYGSWQWTCHDVVARETTETTPRYANVCSHSLPTDSLERTDETFPAPWHNEQTASAVMHGCFAFPGQWHASGIAATRMASVCVAGVCVASVCVASVRGACVRGAVVRHPGGPWAWIACWVFPQMTCHLIWIRVIPQAPRNRCCKQQTSNMWSTCTAATTCRMDI